MFPIRALPLVFAACAAVPAFSKGILVRFLPCEAADSAARYDVYRSAAGIPGRLIGSLPAVAGADTLAFPDTGALKGLAYAYSIRAVDRSGGESDPSDSTLAAIPLLSLPDTLRAEAWPVFWTLPASARPLGGSAELTLDMAQPGPAVLRYDAATGRVELLGPAGKADTAHIVLRGSYLGKFADEDTVLLMVAGAVPVAITGPAEAAAAGYPRGGTPGIVWNGHGAPFIGHRKPGQRTLYDATGRSRRRAGGSL